MSGCNFFIGSLEGKTHCSIVGLSECQSQFHIIYRTHYLQAIPDKPPFPSHQSSRRAIWNIAQLPTCVCIRCVTPRLRLIISRISAVILDETKRRIFLGGKKWFVGRGCIPTLTFTATDRRVDSTAIIGLVDGCTSTKVGGSQLHPWVQLPGVGGGVGGGVGCRIKEARDNI